MTSMSEKYPEGFDAYYANRKEYVARHKTTGQYVARFSRFFSEEWIEIGRRERPDTIDEEIRRNVRFSAETRPLLFWTTDINSADIVYEEMADNYLKYIDDIELVQVQIETTPPDADGWSQYVTVFV